MDLRPGMVASGNLHLYLQDKCSVFSCKDERMSMTQTIENRNSYRVRGTGGWLAFSSLDFLDIGGRSDCRFRTKSAGSKGEICRDGGLNAGSFLLTRGFWLGRNW